MKVLKRVKFLEQISLTAILLLASACGSDKSSSPADTSTGGDSNATGGSSSGTGGLLAGSGGRNPGTGGGFGSSTGGIQSGGGGTNAAGSGGAETGSGGVSTGTGGETDSDTGGTGATGDGTDPGTATGTGIPEGANTSPAESEEEVALDSTPGRWRTAVNTVTQRFGFVSPSGEQSVLRGISMTGLETGTRGTAAGAGFWMYNSGGGANEATQAPQVLANVVDVLSNEWQSDIIRLPICGSAWTQDYLVKDWGEQPIAGYKAWVDRAVQEARSHGKIVILDLHLWAIAKASKGSDVDRGTFEQGGQTYAYEDWEDGCSGDNNVDGVSSCAPEDWYTTDRTRWECAIANADGVTLHNAHKNREHIRDMWVDIAERYKDDSAVWFELFNEPYTRLADSSGYPAVGANEEEPAYPWDLWTEVMDLWIDGIREQATADNIIIVNGLDWGYSFGPDYGPIANPDVYLPWKAEHANIAYGFHPYQHGTCCGNVGGSNDESISDPYQAGYCAYYADGTPWSTPSGSPLPGGASCIKNGYAATQNKKMPPCHWVDEAFNPVTGGTGYCAGDRLSCTGLDEATCKSLDWGAFEAGGWSRYVLPMAKYGPLIATEFGSFDCSSPFVTTFLRYTEEFDISWTAWALWPQNSGGPGGLGACGYPSVMAPVDSGDFRTCLDRSQCVQTIQPLPWAGQAVYDALTNR